jgi:hypothetical protein
MNSSSCEDEDIFPDKTAVASSESWCDSPGSWGPAAAAMLLGTVILGELKRVRVFLILNVRMKNVYAQASSNAWPPTAGDNLGFLDGLCGPVRHCTGDRTPLIHEPCNWANGASPAMRPPEKVIPPPTEFDVKAAVAQAEPLSHL